MKAKYIMIVAAFLAIVGGMYLLTESDSTDADYTYTVKIYQPIGGDILKDGQNIPWSGGSYTYTVSLNTQITLTATPPTGYQVDDWRVLLTEQFRYDYYSSNPLTLTITENIEVDVYYEYIDYTVSFPTSPSGITSISSITTHYGTTYSASSNVLTFSDGQTVTAPSVAGYNFTGWSSSSGTITSNKSITANYSAIVYNYTVKIYQPTGGDIFRNGQNIPWSGGSYTYTVSLNTQMTLTADPGSGMQVDYWQVLLVEPFTYSYYYTNSITLTITEDIEVRLYYDYANYTVSFPTSPSGITSISSITTHYGTTYSASSNVLTFSDGKTVTAPSVTGYTFTDWSSSSGTITSNTTITANYTAVVYTYTVKIYQPIGGGDILKDGQNIPWSGGSYTYTETQNTEIVLSASPSTGMQVDYWQVMLVEPFTPVEYYTDSITLTITEDIEVRLYYDYIDYTVTFNANGGSTPENSKTVRYNMPYGQLPTPTRASYNFAGWYTQAVGGTKVTSMTLVNVAADHTLYAHWSNLDDNVYWTNGHYNGKVDLLFQFSNEPSMMHSMSASLYTGSVDSETSETAWTATGHDLEVTVSYYPKLTITAAITGTALARTITPGAWNTVIVSLDPENGIVSVTPIRTFSSFTDYTVYDNQKKIVLDFSKELDNAAIHTLAHGESGGGEKPRFSVISTKVFLDTYGVVLYNPTINLFDYFPQYDNIRVNFYSFALYGDSITINNQTYAVVNGKITIQYVSDHGDNYLPGVLPNATIKSRTFELTNIYITYDNGHCFLTFVNDRFTIDLGAYNVGDESISMTGLWYFATMVYSPYTAMEKQLSDWKFMPETTSAQMVLIFIGILFIAGAAVAIHARKKGLGIIDLIIIGGALLVGLLMLGM